MCLTEFAKKNKTTIQEYGITFAVTKKIKFGQAVYVCGSTLELGLWKIEEAFRLNWN